VPGGPGRHQHRSVRVPDDWAAFGESAAAAGTNRAKLIVAFIRWSLRLPGAELFIK
jgi:hypothetical protein